MARKPGSNPQAMKTRAAKTAAVMTPGSALAQGEAKKKRTSPGQFFKEVRAEARKITWTTRKETWITSVMVGIMVLIAAVFFFVVDWILGSGMSLLLQLVTAG
jgi:preprotein translocase subunit SecE